MPKVRDNCRLHQETVMNAKQHIKKKVAKKAEKATIVHTQVHPLIKKWLNENGYKVSDRRLEKRANGEEVIIHNHPRKS